MAALPTRRILDFDSNEDAAGELIGCWLEEGPQKTTAHQRYIFMHSIFRAAVNAGARGHVAVLAGELAAEELEGLMMAAIQRGSTGFVIMTGQLQLEQFGKMLGDYYILAMSKILPLLASLKSEDTSDAEKLAGRLFEQMTKDKALQYIAAARKQRAGDSKSIETLDQYERMLNSI